MTAMNLPRAALPALVALLVVAPVGATTIATGKPAASQPATAGWSTRDQLRECLATEAALKERGRVLDVAIQAHVKMSDDIEAENERLEQLKSQLDDSSEKSVKAFNVLVKEHNLHVKALNKDAADSQPATDAYNADLIAFNHRCSGARYRIEDMEAVTRERQKAAAQAAAASGSL